MCEQIMVMVGAVDADEPKGRSAANDVNQPCCVRVSGSLSAVQVSFVLLRRLGGTCLSLHPIKKHHTTSGLSPHFFFFFPDLPLITGQILYTTERIEVFVQMSLHSPNPENTRSIPKVLSVFLVKFDHRKGNTIVWSKSVPGKGDVLKQGIEFRAMPSGLHASEQDVIYFVQPRKSQNNNSVTIREFLPGVAIFCNHGESTNREDIEMFSLGILCEEESGGGGTSSSSWVYVDTLKDLLNKFLEQQRATSGDHKKYQLFETFFDTFYENPSLEKLHKSNNNNHPVLSLKKLLSYYGPLIFEVWKAAVLRSRILLVNNNLTVEECSKFVYIISVLATLPNDINHLVSNEKLRQIGQVNLLYSVTLSDIPWLNSEQIMDSSFLATTKDCVILDKEDLYDFALITDISTEQTHLRTSSDRYVYATQRGNRRFQALSNTLNLSPPPFHTSTSFKDRYGTLIGGFLDGVATLASYDTVNGFLWWASAGEQSNGDTLQDDLEGFPYFYNNNNDDDENATTTTNSTTPLLSQYSLDTGDSFPLEITVIGYFHQMTRRLFKTCVGIIQEQDYDNGGDPNQAICLELNDISNMGLDPYSSQDREFAVQFIRVWWNRDVKINQQFLNFCCR